ncbi:MAG: CoA transferase [Spirochaeta sp.]|jgi:crotonobetainyl-CoA:carnitine CoA-transferase CaiB-like acyl-CoA transferase|nr:CoA transferase [Spirochaeta sp.]
MNATVLAGITVLDLTQALAGPYCTQLLADMGAEVIKIERPGSGDQSRGWGPPFVEGESTYFMGTNRNKRSLTLNLQDEAAREVLFRLIENADVLVHNVPRRTTQQKLGIDAESVRERNPRLVWAAISGFGMTGPEAEKPGYDVIAQAMSGTMALTGEPDSGPTRFPTPMADITTGMYTAMGILAALFEREHSGEGQEIDVALLDSQATWLSNVASAFLATGTAPAKRGNVHPNIAPYQPFRAQDGWFILAAGTEEHWRRVVALLGAEDSLGNDARFATNRDRVANRAAMEPLLEEHFRTRPVAEWITAFESAGVPCGPILTPEEALTHPHLRAREMVVTTTHPVAGDVTALGNPIKFSRTPATVRSAAPTLSADSDDILHELGYEDEQIFRMRERGVV